MTARWFDARLSIGNLITIGVVAAGIMAGWFQFDARLTALEKDVATNKALRIEEDARLGARLTAIEAERQDLATRVIRIEERIVSQGEKLDRVLRAVDRGWRPE